MFGKRGATEEIVRPRPAAAAPAAAPEKSAAPKAPAPHAAAPASSKAQAAAAPLAALATPPASPPAPRGAAGPPAPLARAGDNLSDHYYPLENLKFSAHNESIDGAQLVQIHDDPPRGKIRSSDNEL